MLVVVVVDARATAVGVAVGDNLFTAAVTGIPPVDATVIAVVVGWSCVSDLAEIAEKKILEFKNSSTKR